MARLLQVHAFGVVGAGRGCTRGGRATTRLLLGGDTSFGFGGLADAAAGEVRLARRLALSAALRDRDRRLGRRTCQFRL